MIIKEMVKKVSSEYSLSEDEFLKISMKEFLLKKRSEIETDILDIFIANGIENFSQFEEKIKTGQEHPAWENLIILENLNAKLVEISNDIKSLS